MKYIQTLSVSLFVSVAMVSGAHAVIDQVQLLKGIQGWEKGFFPMERNIDSGKTEGTIIEQTWYDWQVKKSVYEEKMGALVTKLKQSKASLKAQADVIIQKVQQKQPVVEEMKKFTAEMAKSTRELAAEAQAVMEFTYYALDKTPPLPYQTPNYKGVFDGWINAYKSAHPLVIPKFEYK